MTKTRTAFSYQIPQKTRDNMSDPGRTEQLVDQAIEDLRNMLDDADATPADVVVWFDKAKNLVGYKHVGRAVSQLVAQEGITGSSK